MGIRTTCSNDHFTHDFVLVLVLGLSVQGGVLEGLGVVSEGAGMNWPTIRARHSDMLNP